MKPFTTTATTPFADSCSIPVAEIGFDFDGVIADTAEAFIRIACQKYRFCSFTSEDITNFELENCLDIPGDIVEKIFTDILMDSLATGLQPMMGAVSILSELADDQPLTIITARPIKQPVLDWLDHYFSRQTVANLRVIATGDHNDKLRYIQQHGIRYFIDDRADTCLQLAAESITPIVFSQPWNLRRHNLKTVASWEEIRALVGGYGN